jgi:phage FluMu protein Com
LGWVQGSREASTYVHLSGKDTDRAILEMHGLAEEEKAENKFRTMTCPRCNTVNDPSAKFCSQCSLGLDEKTIMDYDQQKEVAARVGFDVQDMLGDKEFMLQMMNVMATEWKKLKEKKRDKVSV